MIATVTLVINNNGNVTNYQFPDTIIDIIKNAAQEDGITPLQWLKKAIQEAAQNRGDNPKTIREFFGEKIDNAQVIESESVRGGIRPTRLRVTDNLDRSIDMIITYTYSSDSPKWAAIAQINFVNNG